MFTSTKLRKAKRLRETTYLDTYNAMGKVTNPADLTLLSRDMRSRKIAVCMLQETHNPGVYETQTEYGDKFIFCGRQENGVGGLAFYVSAEWVSRLASNKTYGDRVNAIRLFSNSRLQRKRGKRQHLVITNVYGYTQVRADAAPELVERFNSYLRRIYAAEKAKGELVLIMEDFAKIGGKNAAEGTTWAAAGKVSGTRRGRCFSRRKQTLHGEHPLQAQTYAEGHMARGSTSGE